MSALANRRIIGATPPGARSPGRPRSGTSTTGRSIRVTFACIQLAGTWMAQGSRVSAGAVTSFPGHRRCLCRIRTFAAARRTGGAATWSTPFELTFSFTGTSDLVGLGNGRAVVAYSHDGTTLSGSLRAARPTLVCRRLPHHIDDGFFPVVAGRGMEVDVVYNAIDGRVWYAHSGDAGVSWDLPIPVLPAGRSALRPAVARGQDGVVVVVHGRTTKRER